MNNELQLPVELPDHFEYTGAEGLSSAEAERRLNGGQGNRVSEDQGKTLREILRSNILNFFNILNFALGLCLLLVGSYKNMLFLIIVIANTLIGTVQELRAQKTMRELQLLNMPTAGVIRDGKETTCRAEELVRGDLVILRAGDQVAADAVVVGGNGSAMESLLTGESDAVPKTAGTWLYSGSYITEGKLTAQLVYVADESYMGRLTREARKTARPKSMLMTELNCLIRLDSMLLIPLGVLLFLKQTFLMGKPLNETVPSSVAAMLGMIPEGLILLTSIAMAVGVIKLGRKQTLVQELCGIETLARVDVLCLDKTGTITSGEMTLEKIIGVDADEETVRQALSRFLGAFDEKSGTLNAIREQIPAGTELPRAVLPFSSKRKKSAASFGDGTTLILGAPEFVLADRYPEELRGQVDAIAAEGRRVTVIARARGIVSEENTPPVAEILGLCVIGDMLRPGAEDTLRYFREQGVTLKVISGDNPRTVSVIARKAGLEGWENWVDATTLRTDTEIAEACEKYTIFGRVTPAQKKSLVEALKKKGHSVAMTGDGVNDIPALKTADCSIAMAGGADAARHAAQLTLLNSDFGVMPEIVLEGRRVINNITRAASLFLTKTLFSFFLTLLTLVFPAAYPFQPIHMTLVSSLTVGLPGFFLALEPSTDRVRGSFLKTVLFRALPGGLAVALCATLAMLMSGRGWEGAQCSTLATFLAAAVGFTVLLRTCLPLNRSRIVILSLVAAALTVISLLALTVPFIGNLLSLTAFPAEGWWIGALLAALGVGIILATAAIVKRFRNDETVAKAS